MKKPQTRKISKNSQKSTPSLKKAGSKIFIISGPSGVGEDSVINGLKKKMKFNRVRTTVTRKPRIGESQGKPYFFTTVNDFKKMIKADEFIEWAIVYGDYRGATKKEIDRVLKLKNPVLWKVDWQGVRTIQKQIPESVSIFIVPGSYQELEQRIIQRKKDSLKTIKSREVETKKWLRQTKLYDYVVVNKQGELEKTIEKVAAIIKKELKA